MCRFYKIHRHLTKVVVRAALLLFEMELIPHKLYVLLLLLLCPVYESRVIKLKHLAELVDTFFDVYNLLGSGEDNDEKLLQKINSKMAEYFQHQEFKIDGLITDNQLATASKNIDSCHKDLVNFIKLRTAAREQRVIECGSNIIPDLRQLAIIGTEKSIYPNSYRIYEDRIKHDGYCNSSTLKSSFNFIFESTIKGCPPAIMSERILHNGTSQVILNECKNNVINIKGHYEVVLSGCYVYDTCELVQNSVKTAISQTKESPDLQAITIGLRDRFPWYNFIIIAAYENSKVKCYGLGDKPSIASFAVGDLWFSVLWTPFLVQPRHDFSFKVIVDINSLYRFHPDMNVTEETMGKYLVISGHIVRGNSSEPHYQQCAFDEVSSGIKTNCPPNIVNLFVLVLAIFLFDGTYMLFDNCKW